MTGFNVRDVHYSLSLHVSNIEQYISVYDKMIKVHIKSTHTQKKREKIQVSWIFFFKTKADFYKKLYVDETFFVIILRTLNHGVSML